MSGTKIKRLLFLLLVLNALSSRSQSFQESADLPSLGRDDTVGFSNDSVGYLVTGNHNGFDQSNRM